MHVSREDPTACPQCGGPLRQDPDTLDTWFSSGLWPFSTLGWPDDTPELRTYYPTSVLITAPDIIFFWVARMAMFGIHVMKEVPFRDVYLHAIVRDAEGQKMSKSKGNVADPLEVMEKFGTDAFRFTLAALAAQGRDIRISEERIEGYRNFANKIWNASRLVLSNLDGYDPAVAKKTAPALADVWIESRLAATIAEVRTGLRRYKFNEAASAVYQFLWHEFCDWYLEIAKLSLYRAESPGQPLGSLSGGNQQKVVVARELDGQPAVLIASQPTRGVDVGSIEFIHRQIVERRDGGLAVLLVSSELDEVLSLADRVAVIYRGRIVGVLEGDAVERERIGLLMAGAA